ncbi:MAG: hypothetical protein ABSB37_12025 [Xanthobacteraceae bacterium]
MLVLMTLPLPLRFADFRDASLFGLLAPAGLFLEIKIAEHPPALSRTMKQALFASSMVQGGGKRRRTWADHNSFCKESQGGPAGY